MGANFDYRIYPDIPEKELKERFREDQERDGWENGHSYSGTIAMARGLEIRREAFDTQKEALDWIDEHAQKWEAALAVHIKGKGWAVGAWCSS